VRRGIVLTRPASAAPKCWNARPDCSLRLVNLGTGRSKGKGCGCEGVATGVLNHQVHYAPVGQRTVTAEYTCEQPLQTGQWIEVGSVYLIVERVVAGKRGDRYHGIALCKPALG